MTDIGGVGDAPRSMWWFLPGARQLTGSRRREEEELGGPE